MRLTPEEIARLRRLCEEATPGPWATEKAWVIATGPDGDDINIANTKNVMLVNERDNTCFIAAARTALPALLDRAEELEIELATATAARNLSSDRTALERRTAETMEYRARLEAAEREKGEALAALTEAQARLRETEGALREVVRRADQGDASFDGWNICAAISEPARAYLKGTPEEGGGGE